MKHYAIISQANGEHSAQVERVAGRLKSIRAVVDRNTSDARETRRARDSAAALRRKVFLTTLHCAPAPAKRDRNSEN